MSYIDFKPVHVYSMTVSCMYTLYDSIALAYTLSPRPSLLCAYFACNYDIDKCPDLRSRFNVYLRFSGMCLLR